MKNEVLLITGGTGSFGNVVLRRFLNTEIKEIYIFNRDEKKQEDISPEAQDSSSIILTGFDEDVVLSFINAIIKQHQNNESFQIPIDYQIENTSWRVANLILGNTKLNNKWNGIINI